MFIEFINLFFRPFGYQWVKASVEQTEQRFGKYSADEEDWDELKAQSGAYKLQKITSFQ